MVDRLTDVGLDFEIVEGIRDGLETLSANMGIDIPDGLVDFIPYAPAIKAVGLLAYNVVKTGREFSALERTEKIKVQVVQALTLMSRIGPRTLLSIVGGKVGAEVGGVAGGMAGTVAPGAGNAIGATAGGVIGGLVGAFSGWRMGSKLNKYVQPRMLDLALNITGLTHDDLFYYKNKPRIDEVAVSFQTTARELAAAPGF